MWGDKDWDDQDWDDFQDRFDDDHIWFFVFLGTGLVFFVLFMSCGCCLIRKRRIHNRLHKAPVVVTTTEYTTQAMPGGATVVNSVTTSGPRPYPPQAGYPMPLPPQQVPGYQMPQPGYTGGAYPMPPAHQQQPLHVSGYPQPPYPVGHQNENPPSYDQVAVADAYQKQQPYNPNFQS